MLALADSTFSSEDGILWEEISRGNPFSPGNRSLVFHDAILVLDRDRILTSTDGKDWATLNSQVPWGTRNWPAFLLHQDALYVLGGGKDHGSPTAEYFNDVWRSRSGTTWELLTSHAPWDKRYWASAASYRGRLFVFSGWSSDAFKAGEPASGNLNDIWTSEDGRQWTRTVAHAPWQKRHAVLSWIARDYLWVAAGYDHSGPLGLFNDVWKFGPRDEIPRTP